jgi:IS30 family transposase
MTYRQITSEERYTIATLRREGFNAAEIARRLGRHRSTISREVRRNSSRWDGSYRPSKAVERTNGRRSRSRRNSYFTKADFALVERKLREDWSPEQISGHLRLHGELWISHETIYIHVWRDKEAGGRLYRHLRCSPKLRRKRHNSYDSRGRLAGKRHISERPPHVEKRGSVGHWEIDTVVGKGARDCVTTLVERKTGYALIGKLADRSMLGTSQRTKTLIRRAPDQFKTITADNGTEFHDYESVERATGVKFYFATPYHSWERGSNENFNGLLRQYLPKRTSQAALQRSSTPGLARGSAIARRRNASLESNEWCTSNLKSDGPTPCEEGSNR